MNLPRKRLFMAMAAADGGDAIRPVMVLRPSAAAANEYELIIYGDIGESWWGDSVTAISIVQQLMALDASVTQINVRMNSYGGSVSDGLAIYNALRRHSARKVGTVDGVAMSSCSLIAMACDELHMPAESLLMIHAPWGYASGNAQDMRTMAEVLDTYSDAMANAYARKSGKPKAEMLDLLTDGEDHFYTGEQALAAGFIDALVTDQVEEDDTANARALGDARAEGMSRFTSSAPAHIRQQAIAAARRQPKAMPPATKPHVRAAAGLDLTNFTQALGSAEGQQALTGALTSALAAVTGDDDMKRRNISAALRILREPVGQDGSDAGGGTTPAQPNAAADVASAMAALRARNDEIQAAFAPHLARDGVQAVLNAALMDPTMSADLARTNLLNHIGAQASAVRVELVADEGDKFRAAGENAILARAGWAKADGQNPYRGMALREMARASLQRAGKKTDGMSAMEIVGAAFTTTSDFPALLTNTARTSLLRGYEESPEVFDQFTRTGTLTDFKPAERAGLGFFSSLDKVPESGEYKYGTFGSQGNQIVLATYGKLFAISRQAIINDDLGAFTDVPKKMGRAAKRTIGDLVFAVLTKNPIMADGKALFAAEHANILTASGITTDAIAAMRVAMGTQKVDKRPVAVPLKTLIVPLALEGAANLVRSAQYRIGGADNSTTPNVEQNRFNVIADARLDAFSTTAWFGAADPDLFDTIEVAYLDGVQQPFLDQEGGWKIDGTEFKVRIDAGVAPLDFRGLAKNAGA